jgi:hypothetical protein
MRDGYYIAKKILADRLHVRASNPDLEARDRRGYLRGEGL